jgi:transcriptional regulator with XRE-family HTH domain
LATELLMIAFMFTARKLRDVRLSRLLSQTALARQAGLTTQTISRLERGEQAAYYQTLHKLARALNVEPQDLIDKPVSEATNAAD